jgi:hypothetical protein
MEELSDLITDPLGETTPRESELEDVLNQTQSETEGDKKRPLDELQQEVCPKRSKGETETLPEEIEVTEPEEREDGEPPEEREDGEQEEGEEECGGDDEEGEEEEVANKPVEQESEELPETPKVRGKGSKAQVFLPNRPCRICISGFFGGRKGGLALHSDVCPLCHQYFLVIHKTKSVLFYSWFVWYH